MIVNVQHLPQWNMSLRYGNVFNKNCGDGKLGRMEVVTALENPFWK